MDRVFEVFFKVNLIIKHPLPASLVRGGKKIMFAIVQTGGKQYKVSEGDVISVEKLENAVGDKIKLDVLLVSDNGNVVAGQPTVKGATCEAEVLAHGKGDKIVVFKYKPKKNERKKQGHRQPFTQLKVLSIKK
jgi:large subunit ribosomal protein L21